MDSGAITFLVGLEATLCFGNRPDLDVRDQPNLIEGRFTSHGLYCLQYLSARREVVLSGNSRLAQISMLSLWSPVLQDVKQTR